MKYRIHIEEMQRKIYRHKHACLENSRTLRLHTELAENHIFGTTDAPQVKLTTHIIPSCREQVLTILLQHVPSPNFLEHHPFDFEPTNNARPPQPLEI